jgi:TolA-binding protein
MTNETTMFDILSHGERLARQDDRVAFFVAVLALVGFGVLAVRHFVRQNELQFEQLKDISRELREVVVNNTATVETCKLQISRNTQLLETFERSELQGSYTQRIQRV